MKILSLHIDGFGKLNDLDLSFEDGLNVLYGKNEAGKSTLHTFIRGMLFGIERQRGRASKNDTYSRFEPWSGTGAYQGWLRLESQGEIFRIERRFQKGNKSLTIINETKGCEETPTAALWERLRCGLSDRTVKKRHRRGDGIGAAKLHCQSQYLRQYCFKYHQSQRSSKIPEAGNGCKAGT